MVVELLWLLWSVVCKLLKLVLVEQEQQMQEVNKLNELVVVLVVVVVRRRAMLAMKLNEVENVIYKWRNLARASGVVVLRVECVFWYMWRTTSRKGDQIPAEGGLRLRGI